MAILSGEKPGKSWPEIREEEARNHRAMDLEFSDRSTAAAKNKRRPRLKKILVGKITPADVRATRLRDEYKNMLNSGKEDTT